MRHPAASAAAALLLLLPQPPLRAQEPAEPPPLPPAEEEPLPPAAAATHQEAAEQLISLLEAVEATLATCVDAPSVQRALPRLRELAESARAFKQSQDQLPEPTTQDYIAAQELLKNFNTAWQAIRGHIERLRRARLITPELRELLVIDPSEL